MMIEFSFLGELFLRHLLHCFFFFCTLIIWNTGFATSSLLSQFLLSTIWSSAFVWATQNTETKSIASHLSNTNSDPQLPFNEWADNACCSEREPLRVTGWGWLVLWKVVMWDALVWDGWGFLDVWTVSVLSFIWSSWWSFASWDFGQKETT